MFFKNIKAYTLSEVLTTLFICGLIAALIINPLIQSVREREIITSALKTYTALEYATQIWMIKENCANDINICIKKLNDRNISSPHGFDEIAKNLNVVESSHFINGDNADGQNISQIELDKATWLPDRATLYDGTPQQYAWQAVSKYGGGTHGENNNPTGLYLLNNGVTLSVQFPDDKKKSGFGFFDANGKKGPNKVGVDIYPFGLGIPYNTSTQKQNIEQKYGTKAKGLNPYYNEDNNLSGKGMCAVRYATLCDDDRKDNPTAWLLIHKKIPNK